MPISPPETRDSLVSRLHDARDVDAWNTFIEIYSPIITRTATKVGLQPVDVEDCVQEVLTSVSKSIAAWLQRPDRGPFRSWLSTVARNKSIDLITRRKFKSLAYGGHESLDQVAQDKQVSTCFDRELHRQIYYESAKIVRGQVSAKTWLAFYRTSVLRHKISTVAEQLNMSTGSIYIARSRVMKKLRSIAQSLTEQRENEL